MAFNVEIWIALAHNLYIALVALNSNNLYWAESVFWLVFFVNPTLLEVI